MASDPEVNDPLLRAIAELRSDVNLLIDEQLAYVKDRLEDLVTSRALRAAPVAVQVAVPVAVPVAVASVPEPPEETSRARTLDPRQRLDALAKHLDHRLRQANVPPPERTERTPVSEG
jgi:hypothetical protein